MFREVVGTMFNLQGMFVDLWKDVKRSRPTAIFGFGLGETEMPPPVSVDKDALYKKFHEGVGMYTDAWKEVFAPETNAKLQEVLELEAAHYEFPVQLWAHILFDVSVAYRDQVLTSEVLMDALSPLYYGRTLSFVRATEGMAMQQAEEYIEEQCLAFEEAKPYLLERWGD